MSQDKPLRSVSCPTCRRAAPYSQDNPWRPFCSERCRSADLGAWASERFRIAEVPADEPDDGEAGISPPSGGSH